MPLALEASKDNSVAQELLQRSITPFRRGKKKKTRPIEDDTPAEAEAFAREMDDLLPDSQGQVKDNRYDRKLQREGAEDNDNGPAPQPKKRSILERV